MSWEGFLEMERGRRQDGQVRAPRTLSRAAFLRVRTFARLPNVQDLKNAGAAVVGTPFGTGKTFCVGARFGPEGLRNVSHQT